MKKWLISFRLHPLFLLLVVYSLFGHFLGTLARLFAVILLHELGHAVVAIRLGYSIDSVELYPFGGVARLSGNNIGWKPRDEVLIAIAGPLVNLVLALAATLLMVAGWLSGEAAKPFIGMNFTLLFFNLLPALPLDGGRIGRAGLAMTRGFEAATEVMTRMSFALSAVLVTLGGVALWFGYADAGMLILGAFLFVSAFALRKQNRYDMLRFLDFKRREAPSAQALRTLIVDEEMGVGQVAAKLIPGAYHLIYLQNRRGPREGSLALQHPIQESELLQAIFDDGLWLEPIAKVLRSSHHL